MLKEIFRAGRRDSGRAPPGCENRFVAAVFKFAQVKAGCYQVSFAAPSGHRFAGGVPGNHVLGFQDSVGAVWCGGGTALGSGRYGT